MTSTYNKINRLKAQGWTWETVTKKLDQVSNQQFDLKTIKSNATEPHREPNKYLREAIDRLHDNYFTTPYPCESEALMSIYNALFQQQLSSHSINAMHSVIKSMLDKAGHDEFLLKARLLWIEGNINFDQLALLRNHKKIKKLNYTRDLAVKCYTQSFSILNSHKDELIRPFGLNDLYKLQNNILGCYINSLLASERNADKQLKSKIEQSLIFQLSEEILKAEPFQWQVARNALRFASLLKSAELVTSFYELLVTSNKRFEDLNYEPTGCPCISESADFEFAFASLR